MFLWDGVKFVVNVEDILEELGLFIRVINLLDGYMLCDLCEF